MIKLLMYHSLPIIGKVSSLWQGVENTKYAERPFFEKNYSHTDTKLYIGFDASNKTKVLERFKNALDKNRNVPIHVRFDLKNSYFSSLSQSVWRISPAVIAKIMPDPHSLCVFDHVEIDEFLPEGTFSADQRQALKMVICSPSNGPPCLITGPFGTGKSHLLATAAYWLFRNSYDAQKSVRILVCTQQRESADHFFLLYHGLMSNDEDATVFIVRDYGFHNAKLRKRYITVNGLKERMDRHLNSDSGEIKNFLIISPCLTALRLQKARFLQNFFTHIFIDEGAQMREPEAIAPLSLASENTKVVIAGDQWQVLYVNFSDCCFAC